MQPQVVRGISRCNSVDISSIPLAAVGSGGRERGFTLIELTVGMVIFSIMAAFGTSGWLRYQRSVEHRGTAQEVASALRNAQQSSLAEATTYCVQLDPVNRAYRLYKFSCGLGGIAVQPVKTTQSSRVGLSSPAFLQTDGSTSSNVMFFPRGAATKGSVKVTRQGSTKSYTISVEGLTGRVSLAG